MSVSDDAVRILDAMQLPPFVVVCLPVEDRELYADPMIKMANVYVDGDFHRFITQEAEYMGDQEYFTPHGDGQYLYIFWLNWCETYETPYWETERVELLGWQPWSEDYSPYAPSVRYGTRAGEQAIARRGGHVTVG